MGPELEKNINKCCLAFAITSLFMSEFPTGKITPKIGVKGNSRFMTIITIFQFEEHKE